MRTNPIVNITYTWVDHWFEIYYGLEKWHCKCYKSKSGYYIS